MPRLLPSLLTALALLSACQSTKSPAAPQLSQGQGFQISWDAQAFRSCTFSTRPRLTSEENGTDIPIDVAPQRVRIDLVAPAPRYWVEGEKRPSTQAHHLELIPLQDPSVADFAKAYPYLTATAKHLQATLMTKPKKAPFGTTLPDLGCVDVGQSIHARITYLDSPWCSGLFFISQYGQEGDVPINNAGLTATFQGLSKDGRFYIDAAFPVCHPDFTSSITDLNSQAKIDAALYEAERRINRATDSSFSPSLQQLIALITSLGPVRRVEGHVAPKS